MSWEPPSIPLTFPNVGNALAMGAHAAYLNTESGVKRADEQRKIDAQGSLAPAMAGDPAAMGKLAYGDPKAAIAVSTALQRMDSTKRANVKAAADYTTNAANAILQAGPAERPAIYKQLLQEGQQRGYDMSTLPPEYSPALDPMLRTHRQMGIDINKELDRQTRLQIHNTPGGGGGPTQMDMPGPGGPPAAAPVPGRTSMVDPASAPGAPPQPVVAQAAPVAPPVAAAPQGVPQAPPGAPPVQMAQAGPQGDNGPVALNAPPDLKDGAPPQPKRNGAFFEEDPSKFGYVQRGVKDKYGNVTPQTVEGGYFVYRNPQTNEHVLYKPSVTGRFEDVKDQTGKLIGQRDTSTNQFHPINQTQGGAALDPSLKGDDVYAALPPARAAEIKSIVEGDNPIPSPNARNQYAQETRQLVFQAAGDGFTDATHKQRMEMKTAMTKGKIGDTLTTQGTLFNHLAELQSTAEDLKNTPYPVINKIGNVIGLNTGDPRVTNMATIKHRVNEEAEKYFGGSGAVTVSGLAEAQKELNEAQSPEQLTGAVHKLVKLIAGRQSELTSQINRGLQYPKDKQLTMDDLLTPEAKASRDKIMAGFPPPAPNAIKGKLGLGPEGPRTPDPGARPPLEQFQK